MPIRLTVEVPPSSMGGRPQVVEIRPRDGRRLVGIFPIPDAQRAAELKYVFGGNPEHFIGKVASLDVLSDGTALWDWDLNFTLALTEETP